ncbi:hypothetical protein APR04_005772 [Promicromonospora umidemergens]|uniref:N-acetyltransferase domain-containing protein n=1 Tax=Promicromonospora umidemergens TaxID=629679 RepID=A0ABP8WMN4_9MICO|nr:XF1762 family protein [Promicromonospora umidemergens]MCP2286832.1 hypothetical protein [Promicromonospora umidemergens]
MTITTSTPRTLRTAPIGLRAANAWVAETHRHHGPVRGHKFSVAVVDAQGSIHGVGIAGRPVARVLDDGEHLEVLRVATDGTPNACSMIYGALRRAAIALGYSPENVLTYTLRSEPGTSLRAAGWHAVAHTTGDTWERPGRARVDRAPTGPKTRWHAAMTTA